MAIAGILCLMLFAVLAVGIRQPAVERLDAQVTEKVVSLRRPAINKVMFFFTQLGRFSGVVVVMIALALIPGFWWKVVRPAGIALTISWWLAFAMKRGMKRPRPEGKRLTEETDHSFLIGCSSRDNRRADWIFPYLFGRPFSDRCSRRLALW